jgi:Transport and Golgi organisation 2
MCTVIILHRPDHAWPLLLGANRDEKLDRRADPPGPWWPEYEGLIGGRDRTAGGTWLAMNPAGVVACVLNRPGSLGPAPDKRSRGVLPLLAIARAPSAAAAADAVASLDAGAWRPFNIVLADRTGAWFGKGLGSGRPQVVSLAPGFAMVTAHDPNDLTSPRTARHLPRFQAAPVPEPAVEDWLPWENLLADGHYELGLNETLCVPPLGGFGTVSSSLIGLPRRGAPVWRFAPGPPDRTRFAPVALAY